MPAPPEYHKLKEEQQQKKRVVRSKYEYLSCGCKIVIYEDRVATVQYCIEHTYGKK